MSGFIAVSRDFWNDPDFADAPMTEREAFLWLLAEASWKERRVRRGREVIELGRGQLAHSVRFMAQAWGWSKSAGHRFLKKLEKRDTVRTASGTDCTIITVCNYEKYQSMRDTGGTPAGHRAGHRRDTGGTNENQDNQDNQDNISEINADFERLWSEYPAKSSEKGSKKKALDKFKKMSKADRAEMIASMPAYADHLKAETWKKAKHVTSYISGADWQTYLPQSAAPEKQSLPPAELTDSREHKFLAECRNDGANEFAITRFARPGRFKVDDEGEGKYLRVDGMVADFEDAFGRTAGRYGYLIRSM